MNLIRKKFYLDKLGWVVKDKSDLESDEFDLEKKVDKWYNLVRKRGEGSI